MRMMTEILADGYIGVEKADGEYWIEGEPVRVQIENADGYIRVGVMLSDRSQESVGLYFSPVSARDFIVGLGAAIRDAEAR